MIDHQIARHFVHYSECLYHSSQINHFLTSRISANHDKGLRFAQLGNPYTRYCSDSVESLLMKIKYSHSGFKNTEAV